jgi:hypothetical protein
MAVAAIHRPYQSIKLAFGGVRLAPRTPRRYGELIVAINEENAPEIRNHHSMACRGVTHVASIFIFCSSSDDEILHENGHWAPL